jgi:hypothetical protein
MKIYGRNVFSEVIMKKIKIGDRSSLFIGWSAWMDKLASKEVSFDQEFRHNEKYQNMKSETQGKNT